MLETDALASAPDPEWDRRLYRVSAPRPAVARRPVPLTLVPYFAWANRAPGRMRVWLRRR